ncbi:putative L,D-transpeptidase YkuD [compost metagenome]
MNPIGSKPKVYGVAGLGLGDIAIHGTYEESSIGQDVSLGCIRLKNSDIEELFAFVPKGTEVMIKERGGRVATKLVSAAESNRLIPAQLPIVDETPENHIFAWLG